MSETRCWIKCESCKRQFRSPLQFDTAKVFYSCALAGNDIECSECGAMVSCKKENMIFQDPGAGAFETGEDTIPKG